MQLEVAPIPVHLGGRSSLIQSPASIPPFLFPFCLFRNGGYVSSIPVSGNFPGLAWFHRYDGQWLSNVIHQFPWDPWTCEPSGPLDGLEPKLLLPWAVSLTFSAFAFCDLGREAGALDGEDWGKKVSSSAFCRSWVTLSPVFFQRGPPFSVFFLLSPTYL